MSNLRTKLRSSTVTSVLVRRVGDVPTDAVLKTLTPVPQKPRLPAPIDEAAVADVKPSDAAPAIAVEVRGDSAIKPGKGLLVRYVGDVATDAVPVTLTPPASVPRLREAVVDEWVTAAWEMARRYDLETGLYLGLKADWPGLAVRAIEEADNYPEADAALRRVFFEMSERPTSEGLLQVWTYGKRVMSLGYKKQKRRGRPRYKSLARDFTLCLAARLVCRAFGLHPTRSQKHSQCIRSDRAPSGISVVLEAWERMRKELRKRGGRGDYIDEASFQKNQWKRLPGELACRVFGIP